MKDGEGSLTKYQYDENKNFVVKQFDKSFITSALKKIMAKLAFASFTFGHSVNTIMAAKETMDMNFIFKC